MSFVSPEFGLLCVLFFPLYWALAGHRTLQKTWLILSGYALYASWVPEFALILAVYSTVVWWLGAMLQFEFRQRRVVRWPMVLGLWLCGIFLGVLKYYEFVRATFQALLVPLGLASVLPAVDVVTPVGVSFFTFQAITYLVWVGRSPRKARSWSDVMLFLSFWPTLFAGPILRAEAFFAQEDSEQPGQARQVSRALYWIGLGLFQKMVLASWLAEKVVDPVFKWPEQFGTGAVAAAMLGYSLQIFFDFAGYTLIVSGLALLLGYKLPVNFRQPYLALNVQDFWTRWHVSLSSFIRDYIYIPLGGNRHGWTRTQVNVLLGMLISGLWHGASWTFVVWGALHGLAVVAYNLGKAAGLNPWPRWLSVPSTFVFVTLAWVFFRADSLDQAGVILGRLIAGPWNEVGEAGVWIPLMALCAVFWGLSCRAPTLEQWVVKVLDRLGLWASMAMMAVVLFVVIALGPEGVPGFIYYRF
jgi:alginate O-acetyltransferase complex protein AlgI